MLQKLILENVRCFRGRHEIPLRPLTFLIGENSTGKTTCLAAAHIASRFYQAEFKPDFNEPPFNLGAYEQIASLSQEKNSAQRFSIGIELSDGEMVSARFRSITGQPSAMEVVVASKGNRLVVRSDGSTTVIASTGKVFEYSGGDRGPSPDWLLLLGLAICVPPGDPVLDRGPQICRAEEAFKELFTKLRYHYLTSRAIAPIRSNPERIYSPKTDAPRVEGDHVPMVLYQTVLKKKWNRLQARLTEFGVSSGLFAGIDLKRLGKSSSSPFQLMFKMPGTPSFNLMDVGYGISQVLPILVDAITNERGQLFLMQQPEVHLHPKAQAELATFLGYLAKNENKQFIVETHSDYMIDRACLDVRDKKNGLTPDDVMILYFQRERGWVKVHPITIDAKGNLVGAPKGYRDFFLKEQARLFGV
jgi:hypothetical protein